MTNYRIIFTLLCCLSFIGCGDGDDEPSGGPKPALSMTIASSGANSVTLNMKRTNATSVKIIYKATGVITSETAQSVAQNGTQYTGTTVEIDGLAAQTTYTVFAVACNDSGEYSQMQYVRFTTDAPGPQMYPWEQSRNGILSYTDMVLCYGGSHHRTPYRWDKERFAPSVSYVDEQGKEHWLFDSFLFIEFQDSSRPDGGYYAYMVGLMKDYGFSAGKTQWKELIDYWFAGGSGMDALEGAVKDASARLGAPPSKRKVIMVLPDPIIYKVYDGKGNGKGDPGSTVYWGELNGRKMDFSTAEDRIAAYKWYVDEVRRRFDLGNYQYIDLAGVYIISEELVTPGDGWNHELKKSDEIIHPLAEYLHAINQSLNWIPYNRAAGYKKWQQLGVDYAYMQPNYFWEGQKSLSQFFSDVKANHTISASFSKTTSAAEFDNDFEQDEFPGHGWTVKSENTGCTWYAGTNRNLNTTHQARIDFDYYEYEGYGIGEVQPMAAGSGKKQNEYLISPVVDLTGKTPTLSFDYLLFKYMIQNDIAKFTVEATIDGGQTWTTIWNAADLDAVSG